MTGRKDGVLVDILATITDQPANSTSILRHAIFNHQLLMASCRGRQTSVRDTRLSGIRTVPTRVRNGGRMTS